MTDYALESSKWGSAKLGTAGGTVSWALDASVSGSFLAPITAALADWAKYADVTFVQAASAASANITFSSAYIDGRNSMLGEASYSFSSGSMHAAHVTFDDSEGWNSQGSRVVSNSGADLFTVALHEIGHAIGLDHYNGGPAVMNSVLTPSISDLTASDIHGVLAIYGPSGGGQQAPVQKPLSVSDLLGKPASDTLGDLVDFDGNHLGAVGSWKIIGQTDIQGDRDMEYVLVNQELGRWATLGPNGNDVIDLANHGQNGDTRVVGVYIDPYVQSGAVRQGSDFDSQQRLAGDLRSGNLDSILGAGDYDANGLQEVYFGLRDHSAVLHAYMHPDGNIEYANYQSGTQMSDYLASHGVHTDWVL